jgi:exosortase H (IPTLxxWG-CTERM-specific)
MKRHPRPADPNPPSPSGKRPPSLRGSLIRIYLVFGITLLAIFTITMIKPVYFHVVIPFNEFLAWSTAGMLRLLGTEGVTASGAGVSSPGFGFTIAEGCNGIYALAIVLAGIIAFPARWKPKLAGLVMATVFVMALNYIRLLTLWYAGNSLAWLFDTIHLYIWEFVIIALGAGFWYVWYEKFVHTA